MPQPIALRWFDRWVMGIKRKTHVAAIPKVTQWVYGKDKYVVQRDWPNPKLKPASAGSDRTDAC